MTEEAVTGSVALHNGHMAPQLVQWSAGGMRAVRISHAVHARDHPSHPRRADNSPTDQYSINFPLHPHAQQPRQSIAQMKHDTQSVVSINDAVAHYRLHSELIRIPRTDV